MVVRCCNIHTLLPGVDRSSQRCGAGHRDAHLVVRIVDAEGRGHLHQPALLHHKEDFRGGHNHGPAAGVMVWVGAEGMPGVLCA